MKKKVFIRILIGKEEEDLLKSMDKKELKKLEEMFDRIKPTLDRLGKKECTDEDIKSFIKLIEENHCRECKFKNRLELFCIDGKLPEDYYGVSNKYNEEC